MAGLKCGLSVSSNLSVSFGWCSHKTVCYLLISKKKAPLWLKGLRKVFTFGARKFDQDSRGVELSKKLQSLGPTYIKLGQSLATRPDIVGLKLAKDLQFLQDSLPAFPMKVVEKLLIDELEQPVSELFDDFGPPVCSRFNCTSA